MLRGVGGRALGNTLIRKLLATLLLLGACADPAERPASAPAADAQPEAPGAGCQQFTREGLKLAARSRAELLTEAGRPTKTEVEVVPNRHVPDQQDSIIRMEYDGMTVQLRRPGPGGEMFEYVAVTKRKWLNFPFFKPGVSEENVVTAMGEPQRRDARQLIYECGGGEVENPVVFELEDGAVQRIVFNYYVD